MKKAIFIDRDGVINEDLGYVNDWSNFRLYNDFLPFLEHVTKASYIPIIVTNQSGIYRGYYTENKFHHLMLRFNQYLIKHNFEPIHYYYCPHSPNQPFECECRKPLPGMVLKAIKEFNLKASECILVGDKMTDIYCARAAKIQNSYLLSRNYNFLNSLKSNFYTEISSLHQIKLS